MENLIKKWYDHGVSVHFWYDKLTDDPNILDNENVIEFFKDYEYLDGIYKYHVNHDMGKPYIVEYDSEGKSHYPNHSQKSYEMYCEKFGEDVFAELIRNDMVFHSGTMEEIQEYCKNPLAKHSYATAWAEIYANAELFGGVESTSFKIKKKKLIRALKYVIK